MISWTYTGQSNIHDCLWSAQIASHLAKSIVFCNYKHIRIVRVTYILGNVALDMIVLHFILTPSIPYIGLSPTHKLAFILIGMHKSLIAKSVQVLFVGVNLACKAGGRNRDNEYYSLHCMRIWVYILAWSVHKHYFVRPNYELIYFYFHLSESFP